MATFDFTTTKGKGTSVTLTGLNTAGFDSVEVQFSSTSKYTDDLIGRKAFSTGGIFAVPGPIVLTLTGTEVDTIQDCQFRVNGVNAVGNGVVETYGIMTGSVDYVALPDATAGAGLSQDDVNSLIADYAVAHPSASAPKDYATGYVVGTTHVNIYNHFVNADITDTQNVVVVNVGWNSSTVFADTNYHMRIVMNNGAEQDFDLSLGVPQLDAGLGYVDVNITNVWPTGARIEINANADSAASHQYLTAGSLIQFIAVK